MQIINADVMDGLAQLADGSVQCVMTSPPYWGLRDYGVDGQIGLEDTPEAFVDRLVDVFREVRRVLAGDGVCWVNIGDSYATGTSASRGPTSTQGDHVPAGWSNRNQSVRCGTPEGLKTKDLIGIPWRVALALQADGWWLRRDIIWSKCLSGGSVVYAKTEKGESPTTVKDLVRLDPRSVQLWDGTKWNQCLEFHETEGDLDRKNKSASARSKKHRTGDAQPVTGDIEIELRSGERIGCTRDHKWPTARGLVFAHELVVGDTIDSCRTPEPEIEVSPACLPDDDIGWFVGTFLADGSFGKDCAVIQIASHGNEDARFDRLKGIAEQYDATLSVHGSGSDNGVTANIYSRVLVGAIKTYLSGDDAHTKRLTRKCWHRSNGFLRALLQGWLDGDGHYDEGNDRYRLGFCNNDGLASDLRSLSGRIGFKLRLKRYNHKSQWGTYPGWRGELRLRWGDHHNAKLDTEVIAIRQSRARKFWDIVLEDDPHLFALASGVLTHNSNPMPESVTDRCTSAHEYIFMLTKSSKYFYDADAIKEAATYPNGANAPGNSPYAQSFSKQRQRDKQRGHGRRHDGPNDRWDKMTKAEQQSMGRNKRSVWTIATRPFSEAHFATFPPGLPEICIKASSRTGDTVLDPFGGAGTTGLVADRLQRNTILIELNPEYASIAQKRIDRDRGELLDLMTEQQRETVDDRTD